MAENFTNLLPPATSVTELIGNKTVDGVTETVRIPIALVTGGGSEADVNALAARVDTTETDITTLDAEKANASTVAALSADVTALDATIATVQADTTTLSETLIERETIGDTTAAVGTSTLTGTTTRLFGQRFTKPGKIARIGVWGAGAGTLKAKVFSHPDAQWDFEAQQAVTTVSGQMNYYSGADLGALENYQVEAGWTIGFYGPGLMSATTGVSGDTYAISGDVTGDNNSVSAATSKMRAFVELAPTVPLADQIPDLATGVSALQYDITVQLGGFAPTDTGTYFTALQTAATRAPIWNIPFAGILKSIDDLVVFEAGNGAIQTLELEPAGTYRVTAETNISAVAGMQTLPIDNLPFKAGGAIAIQGLRVAYAAGYNSNISNAGSLAPETSYTMAKGGTSLMQMRATVATSSSEFKEGRGLLDYPLSDITDFAKTGTWTAASAGVTPSGSGTEYLRHRDANCSDRVSTTARVKLAATTNIVGLIRYPVEALAYGAIGEADFNAATIKLYRWDGTTKTADASATLTLSAVVGRTYTLELRKVKTTVSFIVTDTVTRASQTVSFGPPAGTSEVGTRAWGYPGLWSVGSAATFSQFSHRALTTKRPRLIMSADSLSEAQSLGADVIYREANLLETSIGQPVIVAARGSANERDMMARLRLDLWSFRGEWWRLLDGTNDRAVNTVAAWSARNIDMIRIAQAAGYKVIIGTLPPCDDNQTFITACNTFILGGGYGPDVRIVDYALALSTGNDRVTQNLALFLADKIHMNKDGHAACAAQMRCDVPELWD